MRRAVRITLVLLCGFTLGQPLAAVARCVPFDFFKSIGKINYVLHGRVTQSNKASLLAADCNPTGCPHRFSVEVIEVLKGTRAEGTLSFQYEYRAQRPEIAVFGEGDDFVFAVSKVGSGGQATLYGTTCGRAGLDGNKLDQVKQALKLAR